MDIEYSAQMETNENETTSPSISVFVPNSVVSHARGQTYSNGESGNMTIRTVFIYYRDAVLFPSNETVLNVSKFPVAILFRNQSKQFAF